MTSQSPHAQKAYREAAVRSANEVQLVIMMYDMLGQDLRRAIEAIHSNDVEARSAEIKHALAVLEQLQGTLNMEAGGQAAQNLDRLYSMARAKLLEAQIKVSEGLLSAQMQTFADLREAWRTAEEERRKSTASATQVNSDPIVAPVPAITANAATPANYDWSA